MIVLRISLTPNHALSTPAIPPHTAPARKPTTIESVISSQEGSAGKASANAAVASPPMITCPSAPIFRTLQRKAMQMPIATSSSGVALPMVCVRL